MALHFHFLPTILVISSILLFSSSKLNVLGEESETGVGGFDSNQFHNESENYNDELDFDPVALNETVHKLWNEYFEIESGRTIQVYKCPGSKAVGDGDIVVPSHLYKMNLTLALKTDPFPGCPKHATMMTVTLPLFTKESLVPTLEGAIVYNAKMPQDAVKKVLLIDSPYLSPFSVLTVNFSMFSSQEYCFHNQTTFVNEYNETLSELTLSYCESVVAECPDGPSCVKKCCPSGQVLDLRGDKIDCSGSGGFEWRPPLTFHSESGSWDVPLSRKEEEEKPPRHYFHTLINCPNPTDPPFPFSLRPYRKLDGDIEQKSPWRLLDDGGVVYLGGDRKWTLLTDVNYCVDGLLAYDEKGQIPDFGGRSESDPWPKTEQVALFCGKLDLEEESNKRGGVQSKIYMICLFVASVFYGATTLVHVILWDKQNVNGWTICCLTFSMGGWAVFLGSAHALGLMKENHALRNAPACIATAILAHYFMLAAFTWLTIISYTIWHTFRSLARRKNQGMKQLGYYMTIGFGGPLIVVLVAVILDHVFVDPESLVPVPQYGNNICFLEPYAQGWYIYYILAVLFAFILVFYAMTAVKLLQFQKETAKVRSSSTAGDRKTVILLGKLSVVLGVVWAFEFISWFFTKDVQQWWWMIFDLYNLLTSVFIFILFGCKKGNGQLLQQKIEPLEKYVPGPIKRLCSCRKSPEEELGSGGTASSNLPNTHSTGGGGSSTYSHGSSNSSMNSANGRNIKMQSVDNRAYERDAY